MLSQSSTDGDRFVDFGPDELALASLLRRVVAPVTDGVQVAEVDGANPRRFCPSREPTAQEIVRNKKVGLGNELGSGMPLGRRCAAVTIDRTPCLGRHDSAT